MSPVVIIFIVIAFGGSFAFMMWKMKQVKSVDVDAELQKIEEHKEVVYSKEYAFLKEWVDGKAIDGLIFASMPTSAKGAVKNAGKDLLKSAATLGTVRFKTVKTAMYAVISNGDLIIVQADTDGNKKESFILDAFSLKNASLTEKESKVGKYPLYKNYILTVPQEDSEFRLNLTTSDNYSPNAMQNMMKGVLPGSVVALDSINKLKQLYPNLA